MGTQYPIAAIEKQLCSNCFYPVIKKPALLFDNAGFCLLVNN